MSHGSGNLLLWASKGGVFPMPLTTEEMEAIVKILVLENVVTSCGCRRLVSNSGRRTVAGGSPPWAVLSFVFKPKGKSLIGK
ncbi:hypothetical protein HPP92_013602 [Vanilla planifolia]|uniref:Uncharacterized protein n=1 Tax=Vanilla planifolia TaxID=51239 RepID=A0A835QTD9_VANPL|nr:hypothetical protein HPP92_013602 [Vanilla planifolia]